MLSVAVIAMLGWRLDKERPWEIFHQEEGRYVSAAPAETETTIKSPELCLSGVFIHTRFFSLKKSHFCLQGIFGSRVDDGLAPLVSPLWTVKPDLFQVFVYLMVLILNLLSQGSGRDPQSVDGCRHHSLPLCDLAVLPWQRGAEVQLAESL